MVYMIASAVAGSRAPFSTRITCFVYALMGGFLVALSVSALFAYYVSVVYSLPFLRGAVPQASSSCSLCSLVLSSGFVHGMRSFLS